MKKFKSYAILLAILLTIFALSACSPDSDNQPNNSEIQNPVADPDNTNGDNPIDKEPVDENENNSPETIEKTGTYVGLIDNNSCEIIIDENPMAFRLSEDIKSTVNDFEPNSKVKITYYENEYEQLILTEIEKTEE